LPGDQKSWFEVGRIERWRKAWRVVAQVKFIGSMVDWLVQASNEVESGVERLGAGLELRFRLELMLE
jgi:hypothetical protein